MTKEKNHKHSDNIEKPEMSGQDEVVINDVEPVETVSEGEVTEEADELESLKNLLAQRDEQIANEKKEYLFLMAEFDNFRKRNVRERAELMKNAAEGVLKGLLPIVDDFERGLSAIKSSDNVEAVKEGMELIYGKLIKYLEQNGVKVIPTEAGTPFDTDLHEAIAMVPGSEENKGKIIDTVTKGYTLNDKVLRHAKVAVGA